MNPFKLLFRRLGGAGIPVQDEIEQFGSDGEETVYRLLRRHFDCVIRNAIVPHKKLYLEKDFVVIEQGIPFVLEIKNWKGEIGQSGNDFYQKKDNGVYKTQKNPVATTNQFTRCMGSFYRIDQPIVGIVVFASPDCRLLLPDELEDVALLPLKKLVSYIRAEAKRLAHVSSAPPIDPARILRCTRFYSAYTEFAKGLLADAYLECFDKHGSKIHIDTTKISSISIRPQHLRLRDKLYVTYQHGASGVFYQRDGVLTVACLDGSYRKIAINRLRHIVF